MRSSLFLCPPSSTREQDQYFLQGGMESKTINSCDPKDIEARAKAVVERVERLHAIELADSPHSKLATSLAHAKDLLQKKQYDDSLSQEIKFLEELEAEPVVPRHRSSGAVPDPELSSDEKKNKDDAQKLVKRIENLHVFQLDDKPESDLNKALQKVKGLLAAKSYAGDLREAINSLEQADLSLN